LESSSVRGWCVCEREAGKPIKKEKKKKKKEKGIGL
jgi:hypothetical protein